MANAVLETLISVAHNSNEQGSAKFLKKIQAVPVHATEQHLNKILIALSPNDQRIVYRARIKHIVSTYIAPNLDNMPDEGVKTVVDELSLKVEDPLEHTEPEKFKLMLAEFIQIVLNCLNSENFSNENKKELIEALQIQEKEVRDACKKEQSRLVLNGLASGILSTAAVGLVVAQGTTCVALSLPVVLLTGGAYLILVSEVGFENAFGRAEDWGKNLLKNMKEMGLTHVYITIKSAHMIVTTNPFPFMENFVKITQQTLADIPNGMIAIAGIAAIPPLYFYNQYTQSCKNASMMDKLFNNEEINGIKNDIAPRP